MKHRAASCFAILAAITAFDIARVANAGPPYTTDDPEPVEYRHWEIYLASQSQHDEGGWSGTAPHVEVNYGAVDELQLHVIVPLAYVRPNDGTRAFGIGDIELGAKYRFVDETAHRPQVGIFPLLEVPTGDGSTSDGHFQLFVPVWLQKSFGDWSTYGGGGCWFHAGTGNRDWLFVGLQVQRKLSAKLSLGGEIFYNTSPAVGIESSTKFNLGVVFDITENHHLMASVGSSFDGGFQSYLAYQLTFGPDNKKPAR